jgi:hypothetical protein
VELRELRAAAEDVADVVEWELVAVDEEQRCALVGWEDGERALKVDDSDLARVRLA